MRPRRLLIALAALTQLASVNAEGDATSEPAPFAVLANTTISCSTALPSWTTGCFVERPVLVLGPVEISIGVDAQGEIGRILELDFTGAHVAPYGTLAVYQDTWSAWAELRLPELAGVPVIGVSDWLRVGFSVRLAGAPP